MNNNTGNKVVDRVGSILAEYGIDNYVFAIEFRGKEKTDIATLLKTESYGNDVIFVSYLICSIMKKHGLRLKEVVRDISECFSRLIFRGEE